MNAFWIGFLTFEISEKDLRDLCLAVGILEFADTREP
jgi:hypothetical protein